MLIRWSPQSTRWFQTASVYTGFHTELSRLILPHTRPEDELCDLGCGAAMIDFTLAPHLHSVTCVDRDPVALQSVKEQLAASAIENIEVLEADAFALDCTWDVVLLVFFGEVGDNIVRYLKMCRRKVIAVVRGGSHLELDTGEPHRRRDLDDTIRALEAKGIKWKLTEQAIEYGQPLESWEDAVEYVKAYRKNPVSQSVEDYLKENLVSTGECRYPYYLPYQKRIGVFIINKEENMSCCE